MLYLANIIITKSNTYIYDALNSNYAKISSEEEILDDRKYADFLINNNFRDIKKPCQFEIKYPYSKDELICMFTSRVKSVTLAVTEQCNLRCKYCGYMPKYIDDNYQLKEMSKETAIKAIDFLMENSDESELCNISFYGGEPLLKLDLIEECIEYVKNKYPFKKPFYNITTNAVLLDDKVTDFLIENDIRLNISFDGPKESLDKYRVDFNECSSFERVYKNILRLYNKNPEFFKKNVVYNVVLFNGVSKELYESIDNLWKSDVNMISLMETEYFKKERDESDNNKSEEKIDMKSYDFAFKNMLKGMKKYYNSFNSTSCGNIILPGGFCIPGVRNDFVTAEGKIIVCEKVDESKEIFDIGNVYSGVDINKVEKLIDETLRSVEKCKCCWAAKFCKICFKDILSNSNGFCESSRKEIEAELGYYLDNISNDRNLINYVANISLI